VVPTPVEIEPAVEKALARVARELEQISAQIAKAQATLQFIGSAVAAEPAEPDPPSKVPPRDGSR
jgi:hypothetical protein